ncbi:hypothetical protein BDK51DRAFT_32994 [Blyttiomyces helicus]|uniref:Helicase C-terminal domain-containing protein n=1 Tax=Blyttiomyces helicus TaxID=388810 RepID=A0A4P9W1J1_9FUNG|nr:hypothetical protein BDK51DRAFT_32994 [Blyttiomyces helicus]|eukprot:RKO84440.1 hypothetical protein BDK51DRAFT_32994 [Blyttiomyces helicus]
MVAEKRRIVGEGVVEEAIGFVNGLDIPTVQVVFNYELPADATDYIHRVGRTARAGRGGLSISLVTERDIDVLHNIEGKTNKKMSEYEVPENSVLESLNEVSLAKRVASMHLTDTNFGARRRTNVEKKKILSGQGSASKAKAKGKAVGATVGKRGGKKRY